MTEPASEPLDETDEAILDQVRALHARLNPPPPDLDERVLFAIALDNVDIEVAKLSEEQLVGSGARGTERTRTITFESDSRTIMLSMVDTSDGRVRIDGWLAPPARLRVELRAGAASDASTTSDAVVSDDAGRFVFASVAPGLAQFLIHPADGGGAIVVTPSLVL